MTITQQSRSSLAAVSQQSHSIPAFCQSWRRGSKMSAFLMHSQGSKKCISAETSLKKCNFRGPDFRPPKNRGKNYYFGPIWGFIFLQKQSRGIQSGPGLVFGWVWDLTRIGFWRPILLCFVRESMKIHQNPWKSMKIFENLWKSIEIWKFMKIYENLWKSMKN